jgi:hypothetical protein
MLALRTAAGMTLLNPLLLRMISRSIAIKYVDDSLAEIGACGNQIGDIPGPLMVKSSRVNGCATRDMGLAWEKPPRYPERSSARGA